MPRKKGSGKRKKQNGNLTGAISRKASAAGKKADSLPEHAEAHGKKDAFAQASEELISPIAKALILIIAAIILVFLVYQFNRTADVKSIEQKCLEVQNSPMLRFPCKCVPTARQSDPSDTIDAKTEPLCTCECEIEGVGKQVFEVRASK